jgi:IclR family transcriptional regulator, KDG regulon repressor
MAKGKNIEATVEITADLLRILANGEQNCSISALSRKAGISRYKTVRLLAGLGSKGMKEGKGKDGRYDQGGAALLLGQQLLKKVSPPMLARALQESLVRQHNEAIYLTILEDARPVLESLARQHNEAFYLTILNGDEVLFLDMVDCLWQVRVEPFVGRRAPFFSNAAGKVMRAIDSWDLLEKIGKRWRRGRYRFPDLEGFRSELELIRAKGVAVDCGGMGEGITSVAVAVRDYAGKVVGALMMLGPSFRLLGERLEDEIIPSLRISAEMLSMKFGYVRP